MSAGVGVEVKGVCVCVCFCRVLGGNPAKKQAATDMWKSKLPLTIKQSSWEHIQDIQWQSCTKMSGLSGLWAVWQRPQDHIKRINYNVSDAATFHSVHRIKVCVRRVTVSVNTKHQPQWRDGSFPPTVWNVKGMQTACKMSQLKGHTMFWCILTTKPHSPLCSSPHCFHNQMSLPADIWIYVSPAFCSCGQSSYINCIYLSQMVWLDLKQDFCSTAATVAISSNYKRMVQCFSKVSNRSKSWKESANTLIEVS